MSKIQSNSYICFYGIIFKVSIIWNDRTKFFTYTELYYYTTTHLTEGHSIKQNFSIRFFSKLCPFISITLSNFLHIFPFLFITLSIFIQNISNFIMPPLFTIKIISSTIKSCIHCIYAGIIACWRVRLRLEPCSSAGSVPSLLQYHMLGRWFE